MSTLGEKFTGEKFTESVSPEIELLKPQAFSKQRYLDSSSSFDSEKALVFLMKPRSEMTNITHAKSSLMENGLKMPSEHRNGTEQSTSGTKRKSSPCVDEEAKRFRIGGEVKNAKVSFIPLSQLSSTECRKMNKTKKRKELSSVENDTGSDTLDTSGYSLPKNHQKVFTTRRRDTCGVEHDGHSFAMDTSGYSISEDRQRRRTAGVRHNSGTDDLDSSGYSVPKDTYRNMKNIECRASTQAHVTRSSPTSSQEASFVGSNSFVLNKINKAFQAKSVAFNDAVQAKLIENTKTNTKSCAMVTLLRLPDAWNHSLKSRNGLGSNPVTLQPSGIRAVGENLQNGQSRLNDDSENVSDGVKDAKDNDRILKLSPKRKKSGEKTRKQIVKMVSTEAKTSSVDSPVKTLTPVMVTTSLHRGFV